MSFAPSRKVKYPALTAPRGERSLQPPVQQIPPRTQTDLQLPIVAAPAHPAPTALARPCAAHVIEGVVLGRYSTLDAYAINIRATSRYNTTSTSASGSGIGAVQAAIAVYQSLARMEKGGTAPLHRVDEYV